MQNLLIQCKLCPHNCKIDRSKVLGRCKSSNTLKISHFEKFNFEEPCISGTNGSGAIFFSNCNLNCIYCQNYEISQLGKGSEISVSDLAKIMLKLQKQNVHNINLVTPTSYVLQIIEAIKIAKKSGLNIPIVYNTNGYENIETLKLLEGYIDIYLPDLKYSDNNLGQNLSKVKNYFDIAKNAISEMYKQTGPFKFDENGILKKGVIIRHLVLPNHLENSKNVLKYIKNTFDNNVIVSIMAQYFPTYLAKENNLLNRPLSIKEYKEIQEYIFDLDFETGYIQELGENEQDYVPNFNQKLDI